MLTGNARTGVSRYDNPAFGKPFAGLLGALEELEVLSMHAPSMRRREAWSIAPTQAFIATVRADGIALSDFGRLPGEEPIILKRKQRHSGASSDHTSGLVDYADTGSTVAMRETVQGFNTFLDGADVAFVDDGQGMVDHRQRHMRRHFVLLPEDEAPRFDRAGRFFGGFWQNLERSRRAGIRVEGEELVDLDFASMFPRLAYATTGTTPPDGDIYALDGLGLEHRPALKLALNTLLFDDFRRTSWPLPDDDETPRLPAEWTVARTKAAILKRHPALRCCFGSGLGFALMHTESVILAHVLDEMRARGIVGLGIHDGLLVPRSRAVDGRTIMETVAREVTGHALPVTVKAMPARTPQPPTTLHI
ncbi:hypothetical protein [Methylobacterium sp. WL9]|uniref:hypothetical protein n=1 Tax=Methylobacterium sp. WL9 TaxID=2603898 RepID=UPI001AEDCB08|nr:hypothetical protein [Methylobacterium sp. WL9]